MRARDNMTGLLRESMWARRPRLIRRGGYAFVVLAAASVEVARIIYFGGSPLVIAGVVLTVVGAGLVLKWPWIGLLTAASSSLVVASTGWLPIVEWSLAVIVLFVFVVRGKPPFLATVVVAVIVWAAVALSNGRLFSPDALAAVVSTMAGGATAIAVRLRRQYWASLEQRATDAIATRELEATQRVAEERLRIARDFHDIVGHQIAVLSMQLGAAEVAADTDPMATREALDAARASVKAVLVETQMILHVLRTGSDEDGEELRPPPGVPRLAELLDSFRTAGLRITATIDEMPESLDAGVDLTIYRIVQEALTNASRHGDGEATVTVLARAKRILIDVTNGVPRDAAPRTPGRGYGLQGMRERVGSANGTLHVGIDDDGRTFRISAVLAADGSAIR
jgi:signal transduction histidine kinase